MVAGIAPDASSRQWGADATAREVLTDTDLTGRLIVITGGAGGIGLAAAEAFAHAGADVLIAGRTASKLDAALGRIQTVSRGATARAYPLDLMRQASIASFAAQIAALDRPVDVLLANAGVIGPLERTDEGIEGAFMISYAGHAILASELREPLTRHAGSRVVTVSSFGHQFSPIIFEDINFQQRKYTPFASYGQSKTASILLAVKLADAWRSKGVDAFALHPGTILTEVTRSLVKADFEEARERGALTPRDRLKSLDQGAATSVWASVDPALTGRSPLYLEDCAVARVIDEPNFTSGVMRGALDLRTATRLWEETETMIGRPLPL